MEKNSREHSVYESVDDMSLSWLYLENCWKKYSGHTWLKLTELYFFVSSGVIPVN